VRKIDVAPREVYWSEGGELLLLACEESYFVLRYDASIVAAAIQVTSFYITSMHTCLLSLRYCTVIVYHICSSL
jgi:hypothetical protein